MTSSDEDLPQWLTTEESVRDIFNLMGFIVTNVSIVGRQIDILAKKSDTLNLSDEDWVIEVTTSRVGEGKGSSDFQKIALARADNPNLRAMIVSLKGFTDDQAASLKKLKVIPISFSELEKRQVNFELYCQNRKREIEGHQRVDAGYSADKYILQKLELSRNGKTSEIDADQWIAQTINSEEAGCHAVLGDLGTGKSTLLEYAFSKLANLYLSDPGKYPVPILVPLGKYKQHSGDLDQMLMSELRRSGATTYPSALLQHYLLNRRILLMLDGLDEVHPITSKEDSLGTIVKLFHNIGNKSSAVVSCRRQFFESSTEELAFFGAYGQESAQAIQLQLRKSLSGNPRTTITRTKLFTEDQIAEYLKKTCSYTRTDIDSLFTNFYGFSDLAKTPVLLSMISTTIQDGHINAVAKSKFPVASLYESYVDRWISRDTGRARLSERQRMGLSRTMADHMIWNSSESESWSNIVIRLKKQEEWTQNPLSEDEIELDIRNSGFLIRDLDESFRFVHRSIMEYLAAAVEADSLVAGGSPRGYPTDGFRDFLAEILAQRFSTDGATPFPNSCWHSSRGEIVLEQQLSVVALMSSRLSSKVASPVIPERSDLGLTKNAVFKNLTMNRLSLNIGECAVAFHGCSMDGSTLVLTGQKPRLEIDRASTSGIKLIVEGDRLDNLVTVCDMDPVDGKKSSLGIPGWVWHWTEIVHMTGQIAMRHKGVTVQWRISRKTLDDVADVVSKLKGIVDIDSVLSGGNKRREEIVRSMISKGYIHEDDSRSPHQLRLTKAWRSSVGKFGANPLAEQSLFADILPGE